MRRAAIVTLMALAIAVGGVAARAGAVPVDDEVRRSQIDAAIASGVHNLLLDIGAQPLEGDVTVEVFLDKTNSRSEFVGMLQQAQQIGGPRWPDEQTCQVRLEIPGAVICKELIHLSKDNADAPIKPEAMAVVTQGWDKQRFSAMGTSTANPEMLRPPMSSIAWKGIGEDAIRQAVSGAREDAGKHLLESISMLPVDPTRKVSDWLVIPEVGGFMDKWLADRPVTLVDFRDDLTVEVTLSVTPGQVAEHLKLAMAKRPDLPAPDAVAWKALCESIKTSMAGPVGIGNASASTRPVVALPAQPPAWIEKQLDAQGIGAASNSKLHSSHLAEKDAIASLKMQVYALPVEGGKTMADLAGQSDQMASLIQQSIEQSAHNYSTDFRPDGSVVIRMSLDLRDLWQRMVAGQ